jgi:hypothetical protein
LDLFKKKHVFLNYILYFEFKIYFWISKIVFNYSHLQSEDGGLQQIQYKKTSALPVTQALES